MLTARQQAIYDFIVEFRRAQGCSPSIPEIQKAFLIRSPNGVVGHLLALEAKGYIRRARRGSRQIDLAKEHTAQAPRSSLFNLPVFRQAPKSPPEPVTAARAATCVTLNASALGFRPKPGCFVLRVRDDGMKDAGVLDGDLVVVQPRTAFRSGQIVVAVTGGKTALRRLVRTGNQWFLKAENRADPTSSPRSDSVIRGVVRTVVRKLS